MFSFFGLEIVIVATLWPGECSVTLQMSSPSTASLNVFAVFEYVLMIGTRDRARHFVLKCSGVAYEADEAAPCGLEVALEARFGSVAVKPLLPQLR